MVTHSHSREGILQSARVLSLGPWGAMAGTPIFYILADQLTLSQPRVADYVHQISNTGTPGFSDLSTAL